jgi:hypothetical protein
VRSAELAVAVAPGAPALDELAVGRELRDAADRGGAAGLVLELGVVRLGDEDAAVGRDQDVVGLGEVRRRRAGLAGVPSVMRTLPCGLNLITV